jgi:hypothetical protein
VAAFVLMLMIFHHLKAKTFVWRAIQQRKKDACEVSSIFFFHKKAPQTKTKMSEDDEKS